MTMRDTDPILPRPAVASPDGGGIWPPSLPAPPRARIATLELALHGTEAAHVQAAPGRAQLLLPTPGAPPPVLDGVRLPAGAIVAWQAGSACYLRATGPGLWRALALAPAADCVASDGFSGMAGVQVLRPGPAALRVLDRALAGWSHATPGSDEEAEAMLRATAICLAAPPLRRAGAVQRRGLMDRFAAIAREARHRAPAMAEVCATLGVPSRTLRACVSDFTGMGPARFIQRHRLQAVRQALQRAESGRDSVTRIALAHGFTELGRFAVAYRVLFGEPPSATLQRPASEAPAPANGLAVLSRVTSPALAISPLQPDHHLCNIGKH